MIHNDVAGRRVVETGVQGGVCQVGHKRCAHFTGNALIAADHLVGIVGKTALASSDGKAHLDIAIGQDTGDIPGDIVAGQRAARSGYISRSGGQGVADYHAGGFRFHAAISDGERISNRRANNCPCGRFSEGENRIVNGSSNNVCPASHCTHSDEGGISNFSFISKAGSNANAVIQSQYIISGDVSGPGDGIAAIIITRSQITVRAGAVGNVGRQRIGDNAAHKSGNWVRVGDDDGVGQCIIAVSGIQINRLGVGEGIYFIKANIPGCAQRARLAVVITIGQSRAGVCTGVNDRGALLDVIKSRQIARANKHRVYIDGASAHCPPCLWR